MKNKVYISALFLVFVFTASSQSFASVKGNLSDNIRIKSKVLGYDLQYRVYLPNGVQDGDKLPTIYITDGQSYAKKGRMVTALDNGIAAGKIKPVIAIFVDARDPDNLKVNRRNEQFFCKKKYVDFFTSELLPLIDQTYSTSRLRDDRVILGVSFGGFNSGCFGLMATHVFGGIAMNSPAHSKFVKILTKQYNEAGKKHLKIFMSVGSVADNRRAVRSFRSVLIKKGYDLTYRQNDKEHNWDNWTPLLPDILNTFFGLDNVD
ncbi:MAG: hypothetical protein KUG78_21265 [Kangiellaceae bacterium]|nr:hypothetical protein [Kangiellaceae bacterium]